MMDSLRNAAKSWVAKLLIGLLAVSFGIWGIADVFRGYSQGSLASVGSAEITPAEYSRAFNRYLQNLQRQTGQALTPEDARKLGIDRGVLDNLIQTAAIDDQARLLKLAVSDAAIAQDTASNPAFHDSAGKFDPAEFRRRLDSAGLSEAGYLQSEREGRLREAVTGSVDGSFVVPKALVEALYRHSSEQRDVRYFTVATADSEVAAPTDDEVKKEYEAQPDLFTAPEYRTIALMKAEPADVASKIEVSDEDLKQAYEKYKAEYVVPGERTILRMSLPDFAEAKKVKDRLAAGEDFMAIAKEHGFSEANDTLVGKTPADFADPAIAGAAFALSEGAVSEPMIGAKATLLLKAAKVLPDQQRSFEEVKSELSERLKLERAGEEIDSLYGAVEDARGASTKFEDIAAKSGIPFLVVTGVDASGKDKTGKDVDLPHKAEVLKAAFASDVGVDNDAISLDNGYVWYEVREVVPSAVKPFDQVKDQARAQVIAIKVRELALSKAKAIVDKARSGLAFEDLARDAKSEIKTSQGLKRNETGEGFDAAAVRALFAVPENGFASALDGDGRTARIMQSQAVLLAPFDANSAESKAIGEKLQTASANDLLTAYLGELQKTAGVKVNETLWRQISGTATQ